MEIKITQGLNHFEDPYKVRVEVFMKEQGFSSEKDEIDDTCTHFTGYVNQIPVASGRCYAKDKNTMMIGRIAVLKEYRKQHLGALMLQKIEEFCKSSHISRLMLSAQTQAAGFYEKCGYHKLGDVYMDEHCPHQMMVKFIQKMPEIKCLISDLDGTLFKIGNELSKGISDENKNAIIRFLSNGNHFAIASSRGVDEKTVIENRLETKVDFIGATGAEVSVNDQIVFSQMMNLHALKSIVQCVRNSKSDATISFFKETEKSGESWISDTEHYPCKSHHSTNGNRESWHYDSLFTDFEVMKNWKTRKVFVIVHPEEMIRLREILKNKFENTYTVNSCDTDLIEILPLNISKASGIRRLAQAYQLGMDQIAAIGDSDNDVSMFDAAEISFCMDHSEKNVQDRADYVVKSVREALELLEIMNL